MAALKFLIVDDDVVSRNKMMAILSDYGECTLCECGKEAIEIFCRTINEKEKFDMVSLDISMPDIKGTDVLAKIRKIEHDLHLGKNQQVKVMMVTSHADKASVRNSLVSGCDGYLIKPFNDELLLEKLKDFELVVEGGGEQSIQVLQEGIASAVKQAAKNLKTGSLDLLKPPDIYMKLKDMLDHGAEMSAAADLLKGDMVITAKLINISNTSIYRGVKKNTSLTDALARLGLREVLRQVCAICTRELYMDTEKKWADYSNNLFQDAMVMAYSCEVLGDYVSPSFNIDPYTMGLMRNIGYIYLIKIVEDYESKNPASVEINTEDIESLLQKYSGSFGSALLKQWEMPVEYLEVARYCAGKIEKEDISIELELINFSLDFDANAQTSSVDEITQNLLETYGEKYSNMESQGLSQMRDKIKTSAREAATAIA